MQHLLAALLIFVLSLPVFWLGLVLMIQPFPYANAFFLAKSSDSAGTRMRTQEWSQNDVLPAQVDVLFLGSSTCMSGIEPNAMLAHGVKGFSFCSSGQRVGNSLHILHAALEESSPSVVVLDVNNNGVILPTGGSTILFKWTDDDEAHVYAYRPLQVVRGMKPGMTGPADSEFRPFIDAGTTGWDSHAWEMAKGTDMDSDPAGMGDDTLSMLDAIKQRGSIFVYAQKVRDHYTGEMTF